jgi:hypothetical protein
MYNTAKFLIVVKLVYNNNNNNNNNNNCLFVLIYKIVFTHVPKRKKN